MLKSLNNIYVIVRTIVICSIAFIFYTSNSHAIGLDVKTYIPKNAYTYMPVVKEETEKYFPELPIKAYPAALIEQESCISLTHKRCWSPTSQLKTKREEGAGLSQITKAYREDGSIRFDSLSEMVKLHKQELKELSWNNVYSRPDLQIRVMLLMTKDNYKALYKLNDSTERLKMADLAYNAGIGRVYKDRMACGLAKDCNPQIWFGHVEKYCTANKKPIYDTRSACDISRHHVTNGFKIRLDKYKPYF